MTPRVKIISPSTTPTKTALVPVRKLFEKKESGAARSTEVVRSTQASGSTEDGKLRKMTFLFHDGSILLQRCPMNQSLNTIMRTIKERTNSEHLDLGFFILSVCVKLDTRIGELHWTVLQIKDKKKIPDDDWGSRDHLIDELYKKKVAEIHLYGRRIRRRNIW